MSPDEKYIVTHHECPACSKVKELYADRLSSGEFREMEISTTDGKTFAEEFKKETGKDIDAVPFCAVKADGKLRECKDEEY